jgi:pimeloyl-ACP methyl ester carboxylesterase
MTDFVSASDGVRLAVRTHGDPQSPTVLCVHGFPDDQQVWRGVVDRLASSFHVVTFDVRGSGQSGAPRRIRDYRLDQLADDIRRIIDAVSPERPVHLIGHDWGSVQAWHVATDSDHRPRIASLTSISGPCLDHVASWAAQRLSAGPRGWRDLLGMWKSPLYMGFLQTPGLGSLACRLGLVDAAIGFAERFETGTRPTGMPKQRARTNATAVKIYTANLPRIVRPAHRVTDVSVQVLAPRRDIFITPASQSVLARWAPDSQVHAVDGGHWAPAFNPTEIADRVSTFIAVQTSLAARSHDRSTP